MFGKKKHTFSAEEMATAPLVGTVNHKVFLGVFLTSQLVLVGMLYSVATGGLAIAALLPDVAGHPYVVHVDELDASSFKLVPGVSAVDNSTPVAIVTLSGKLVNQVINQDVPLPGGGTAHVLIQAGANGTPAQVDGLTQNLTSQDAALATFQNLTLSSSTSLGQLGQQAGATVLKNADITTPFLSANSVTFPNLHVAVTLNK